MNTPAAIIRSEAARNPGCTIDASCSGAVEVYVHFSSPRHSLFTGNASRTATNATKSATPADDKTAPDFVRTSSDNWNC